MAQVDIKCSGPGPHDPESGIIGKGDKQVDGMLCAACGADHIAKRRERELAREVIVADRELQQRAQAQAEIIAEVAKKFKLKTPA